VAKHVSKVPRHPLIAIKLDLKWLSDDNGDSKDSFRRAAAWSRIGAVGYKALHPLLRQLDVPNYAIEALDLRQEWLCELLQCLRSGTQRYQLTVQFAYHSLLALCIATFPEYAAAREEFDKRLVRVRHRVKSGQVSHLRSSSAYPHPARHSRRVSRGVMK
jgi:hypothetical protein